jgi:UDP-glucose:(heptosyl)LPS alpha-1,3-glucosyltransferase
MAPAGVQFCGPLGDVENAYAAADLLVFTPIYEPAANVCTEALVAGLPVLTSIYNGAAELIEPGVTGDVLPDPSDTGVLARAMLDWQRRGPVRIHADPAGLSLERNVAATVMILEQAASEHKCT